MNATQTALAALQFSAQWLWIGHATGVIEDSIFLTGWSTSGASHPFSFGNRNYWTTQVGGTVGVLKLVRALYDDAPVALARKKALADLAVHGKPLQATIF